MNARAASQCPAILFNGHFAKDAIIAWESAQLSTWVRLVAFDWLSVHPRGNTGSPRRSKTDYDGEGPIRGITLLSSSSLVHDLLSHLLGEPFNC